MSGPRASAADTSGKQPVKPPSFRGRLLALLFAPAYLVWIAHGLSFVAEISPQLACGLTFGAGGLIMVVLTALGVRAHADEGGRVQFRLSTLWLVSIPLGIYLTAIRMGLSRLPDNIPPFAWIWVILLAIAFVVITTATLLWLAEALMWLGVLMVRLRRPRPVETLGKPPGDLPSKSGPIKLVRNLDDRE